jgi:glycosyltransferase involved in cell wall biosynthesis
MRVAIVNVQAPFIRGGAEVLADTLREKIEAAGHAAEIIRIPFKWYPPEMVLQHMLACRLIEISPHDVDLVIALKFPAYLVPFANKKLWLLHQFRQAYELWGGPYRELPDTPEGRRVRDAIVSADNRFLPEARAIYTNSRIVAGRLKTYNHIDADEVLYPPLPRSELFHGGDYGDYFFYPSRVVASKRQELAIEAMRHVTTGVRLVLAGNPDEQAYGEALRQRIAAYGLDERITMLGWVSDEQKAELMANALGVLYIPFDEDSYGYVSLEAFQSHKLVITCTDSGGTDELIENSVNGFIIDPSAESLAQHMDQLFASREMAHSLGERAFETLQEKNIGWTHVLERLLA